MQKEKKYKYTKEGQIETRIGCKIIKTKINFYEPRKKTNVWYILFQIIHPNEKD